MCSNEDFSRKDAKAQRKAAKERRLELGRLCAFASLREKS